MRIITLTLSPAFDMHCQADDFSAEHENLVRLQLCQAGGKGINISRALSRNGCGCLAFLVLGEDNADSFLKNLDGEAFSRYCLTVPGRIRENITIHVPGKAETRISFPGFTVEKGLLDQLWSALEAQLDRDTVLTMTGRLPEGIDSKQMSALLCKAAARGAKLVVDSRSFSLEDLKALKPWLIKPNQEEISAYLGRAVRSLEEIYREALELHRQGIENVMISMGDAGALLVCDEGAFIATPPQITVKSTIGAGDSTIAGFLSCPAADPGSRLAHAVAFGTAACLTGGTLPPDPESIAQILPLVHLKTV